MSSGRKEKDKRNGHHKPSFKPTSLLETGDWLDVLDADGVWNVAQVISVPSPCKVEITYDGWPKDYDEVVSIDSHRVAPYNTFTSTVKCWVKYLNWPLWPSVISIRAPGTQAGIMNLAAENRLFVDFFDNRHFVKRDRCWQKKTQVQPFDENFDRKRTGSTGEGFERALKWMLQSTASSTMPKFAAGTLPAEYKLSPAKSVETIRRDMGDEQWFRMFPYSKIRHQMNHMYETTGRKEDDRSSKCSLRLNESLLNSPMQPQLVMNKTKQHSSGPKSNQKLCFEKEMPCRLESLDFSDDSDIGDVKSTSRPKKKRGLQTNTRKGEQEGSRCLEPPRVTKMSKKTVKSVAQFAVKSAKTAHSKGAGQTEMTTKQKLSSIGEHGCVSTSADLLANNSERFTGVYCTKRLKKNDLDADSGHSSDLEPSVMLSMRSEATTEHQSRGTKKKKAMMGLKQHVTAGKARASKVHLSLVPPKMNVHNKETSTGSSKYAKKHDRSSVSAAKCISLDNDEQQDISKESMTKKKSSKVKGRIQEVRSKDSAVVDTCVRKYHSTLQGADKRRSHDDGCSQELRRRFCVMQADTEDGDVTETVKCSKKTVISVPRKFSEVTVPRIPSCFADSMVSTVGSPRLWNLASSVQAPSTTVFSSSKDFSIESWFKRRLMTDFMGSGT